MNPNVRDYLAELEEANKPARALLVDVGRYTNYMRTVVRDMLEYFPKDDPRYVGFSEAAEGIAPAHIPAILRCPECGGLLETVSHGRFKCAVCSILDSASNTSEKGGPSYEGASQPDDRGNRATGETGNDRPAAPVLECSHLFGSFIENGIERCNRCKQVLWRAQNRNDKP